MSACTECGTTLDNGRHPLLPIDTLPWPVEIDPNYPDHLGECLWTEFDYHGRSWGPRIVLRDHCERVLLHEVLHALIGTDPAGALLPHRPEHEVMVRHVTRGLWDAGWRLRRTASREQEADRG